MLPLMIQVRFGWKRWSGLIWIGCLLRLSLAWLGSQQLPRLVWLGWFQFFVLILFKKLLALLG